MSCVMLSQGSCAELHVMNSNERERAGLIEPHLVFTSLTLNKSDRDVWAAHVFLGEVRRFSIM